MMILPDRTSRRWLRRTQGPAIEHSLRPKGASERERPTDLAESRPAKRIGSRRSGSKGRRRGLRLPKACAGEMPGSFNRLHAP